MTEHVTIAFHLAWLVAIWHMGVAGYLIFLAERDDPMLLVIALMKGLLGALIYVLVRDPWWAAHEAVEGFLLPATLLLLCLFSVSVTWLIWQHFQLVSPTERLERLAARLRN